MSRRHVLTTIAVALVTLLLVETFVRVGSARFDDPLVYYHKQAQDSVAHMARLEAAGIRSDLTFVGTSMVQAGIQISTMEDLLDTVTDAHNLALPAAQTPVVSRWLDEVILPTLQPRRVVWGVSSLDFNGGRLKPTIEEWDAARETRPGILGTVDRVLFDISVLSRYRNDLRRPQDWGDLLAAEPPGTTREPRLENLLSPNNTRDERKVTNAIRRRIREQVLNDYAVGEREVEAFVSTIIRMRADGIGVAVVLMPVPPAYMDAHPNGAADFEVFRTWISAELDVLGVPMFDYTTRFKTGGFLDLTHLLGAQARAFSQELAVDLAALGW